MPDTQSQHAHGHVTGQAQCEEMCGTRVGDRRVRVQRPPRTVGRKVAALVRRALASRN